MSSYKISTDRKILLLEHLLGEFLLLMNKSELDSYDAKFMQYTHGLMLGVYQAHLEGRMMTIGRACRTIPLRNKTIALKYLHEAKRRGFISVISDSTDMRQKRVKAEQTLITHVERLLRETAIKVSDMAAKLS